MRGKLIVIEGLDGSGKATQAGLLYEHLHKQGCPVRKVSFPDYEDPSSTLVRMYLSGSFGSHPDDVNAYAASSFFAVDRFASYKQKWQQFYLGGGVIVADRYTTSNAVHQCSKLAPEKWQDFLDWLFDFEYNKMGIPAPDLVVYLAVDPAVSQKLMRGRYEDDESRRDIHERDLEYLSRSRAAAEYCARTLGWRRIECTDGGEMAAPEAILQQVLRQVQAVL